MTLFGFDAFRVKLDPMHRMAFMGQSHNQAVFSFRRKLKTIGQAVLVHNQRMIAGRSKRAVKSLEKSFAFVMDITDLAMHQVRRADDFTAIYLTNGLMTKTDAEDRQGAVGLFDQIKTNSRNVRCAGAGGQDNAFNLAVGFFIQDFFNRYGIIAEYFDINADFPHVMIEVIGKAVIVID